MWVIGIFVLILHDGSDIFLSLGRGYREYKYRNTVTINILNVLGVLSWIGLRIVIFGFCCVFATWYQIY